MLCAETSQGDQINIPWPVEPYRGHVTRWKEGSDKRQETFSIVSQEHPPKDGATWSLVWSGGGRSSKSHIHTTRTNSVRSVRVINFWDSRHPNEFQTEAVAIFPREFLVSLPWLCNIRSKQCRDQEC